MAIEISPTVARARDASTAADNKFPPPAATFSKFDRAWEHFFSLRFFFIFSKRVTCASLTALLSMSRISS